MTGIEKIIPSCKFITLAPLLVEYIKIIKGMQQLRKLEMPEFILLYNELNAKRIISHDKILTLVGKTREDVEFDLALSKYVLDMLDL